MAIEIRQQGEPELYAKAGVAIGQAERAKEERARADRAAEQAAQDRARQAAQEWDLQKMLLNSQQDFAHQQRLHQSDLDGEARAKEWEVQKMELRSQMDFQQDEQERTKNIQSITNQLTTLDKFKDQIDPGQYTDKLFELQTSLDNAKAGGSVTAGRLPPGGKEGIISRLDRAGKEVTEPVTLTPEQFAKTAAKGKVLLKRKSDGEIGEVPIGEVAALVASKEYTLVESPNIVPTTGHLAATKKEFEAIGKKIMPSTRKPSPIAGQKPSEIRSGGFYF